MAGSEKSGYANSKAMILENAYFVLTPSKEVSQEKIDKYEQLVSTIHALPIILDYKEHDYIDVYKRQILSYAYKHFVKLDLSIYLYKTHISLAGLHFSYAIFNCHAYSKIIQKISWNRLKTSFFRLLLSVL